MFAMNRIEMENRIRQQELVRELERAQMAGEAKPKRVPAQSVQLIHSQFVAQQCANLLQRMKTQPA